MLVSAIDHLTRPERGSHVAVFTVYPKADAQVQLPPGVSLHNGSPRSLLFRLAPLCIVYRCAAILHLPTRRWPQDLQTLLDTDVVLAIGGTTFSDAQLLKVIYNVLCLLPAFLLGKPVMMYSQTLGPFQQPLNRWLAKWSLNRVAFVVPRGMGSLNAVHALGITSSYDYFADAAFTLMIDDGVRQRIRQQYAHLERYRGKIVGVSVNSIVWEKATKAGINHNQIWANLIQRVREAGYTVLLIPHSIRPGQASSHNNDLLLVDHILTLLPDRAGIHVIDEPHDSKELRVVVGLADYYLASRFHSMISALCEGVPVAVFGWGYHKYWEVMNEFELGDYCWDASDLNLDQIWNAFQRIQADQDSIREKMRKNLPAVQQSSLKNHDTAWKIYQQGA
jgi:polysaccharide pyruvyl transferase WcaK-like protein